MTSVEKEVQRAATVLYGRNPDWVTFYREILGLHGIVRRCFPTHESLAEFEQTGTFDEIQRMVAKLRKQEPPDDDAPQEPTRVVTVRVPKSLHEAIRVEAYEHRTSMNRLCISKLLQFIDNEMIPSEI